MSNIGSCHYPKRDGADGGATMSDETRVLAGILLLALVTVETGGLYLVKLARSREGLTDFQVGFARAGHAHAGVLLVLSLTALLYADTADLEGAWNWLARSGVPAAAILMPAGFFAASMGRGRTQPNRFVALVLAGAAVLALGLASLGIGLLTA
jgi:hypothetical protein